MATRNTKAVASRLSELRKTLRLTQAELADILEATQPSVSDWERGKVPISRGDLRLAADLAKDDRIVFAWLQFGGPRPEIVRFGEASPSALDKIHSAAMIDLSEASRVIEGEPWVPMTRVSRWLARLSDALGWSTTRSSGADETGARSVRGT